MKDLLDEIINKNFDIAESLLKGHLASIVESKLNEKKKMCAAEMTDYPDLSKSVQKLRRGLTEDETEPPFEKPYGKVESGSNAKRDAERLARKAMKAQKEKADKESKEQVNEMVGKGKLSKKQRKTLSQRIDKKMDDEQVKSLGHKFGGEPFNMDDYNKDTKKLVRNKKYMRMSTMKSKLDYPEYFKEEDDDLEEQKMTPCGRVKSSTGEKMEQSVMKQRKGVVEGYYKDKDIERQEKEEKEKPKRANLPSWGGKKTLQRNVFRKTSDADVRRRLEKEIEDAQRREDEEMR